ncbi:hypothetical protein PUN28_008285 [Cardiocondyla obscurior]|uniref:Uncharacterized protein n=1 Tax=Cardiocondyla obscurior TaxID=286306 RepID=A0AAW2FWV8_9HYME
MLTVNIVHEINYAIEVREVNAVRDCNPRDFRNKINSFKRVTANVTYFFKLNICYTVVRCRRGSVRRNDTTHRDELCVRWNKDSSF